MGRLWKRKSTLELKGVCKAGTAVDSGTGGFLKPLVEDIIVQGKTRMTGQRQILCTCIPGHKDHSGNCS